MEFREKPRPDTVEVNEMLLSYEEKEEPETENSFHCSSCGERVSFLAQYCANCGASLDGPIDWGR